MTEVAREPGLHAGPNSMTLADYQRPDPSIPRLQQGLPLPPHRSQLPTVLDKDKETPDNHVCRDGRLIRLTGAHPFNAEAPLTPLFSEGMHRKPTGCRSATDCLISGRLHYIGRSLLRAKPWGRSEDPRRRGHVLGV